MDLSPTLLLNELIVVAVAAGRLLELGISRRHTRRLRERGTVAVRDPAFGLIVVAQVVLLLGVALEPLLLERPFLPWLGVPALLVFLLAQAARIWVIRTLGAQWNVRILDTRKVASPAESIVSHGPYRWVRHPNYGVLLVEFATLPLFHTAWLTWIVAQLLHTPALLWRMRTEEANLLTRQEYRDVMGTKPRLFPFPGRGRAARERQDASR